MTSQATEFVRGALAAGIDRRRIAEALRQAGWPESDTRAALDSYADVAFPLPVPRPKPSPSAREVFLYLLAFGALYVCAWHVGAMAFAFIDRFLPDPAAYDHGYRGFADTVRWNAAALVVSLPLFLLTFRTVENAIVADPTKRGSWPRRWLTHLTLLFAAVVISGDLVVLVYSVLGGEYGQRFLLKVATVGVIAGGIFTYFLSDMRREAP
ncbi:DUF5671 domain-containing protein [Azospirillum sp. ST 5-10]|uniref:DUF5671 domain-containing protein n=1 Tax=unclassified Azospirillum TaxID=2630922 RepID=UPI003F4A316F